MRSDAIDDPTRCEVCGETVADPPAVPPCACREVPERGADPEALARFRNREPWIRAAWTFPEGLGLPREVSLTILSDGQVLCESPKRVRSLRRLGQPATRALEALVAVNEVASFGPSYGIPGAPDYPLALAVTAAGHTYETVIWHRFETTFDHAGGLAWSETTLYLTSQGPGVGRTAVFRRLIRALTAILHFARDRQSGILVPAGAPDAHGRPPRGPARRGYRLNDDQRTLARRIGAPDPDDGLAS